MKPRKQVDFELKLRTTLAKKYVKKIHHVVRDGLVLDLIDACYCYDLISVVKYFK